MSLSLSTFEHALQVACGNEFRVIHSLHDDHIHVEVKAEPWQEVVDSEHNPDGRRRLHDHYRLAFRFRPAPYVICPECHFKVDIPTMTVGEVSCDYCASRGGKQYWFTGYFPLAQATLTYLERNAPKRAKTRAAEIDAHNAQLARAQAQYRSDSLQAIARDYYYRAVDTKMVGYTGGNGRPHAYGRD